MRRSVALLVHLLRVVTWPHLKAHRLRSTLTVVGISLGVATVVGVADVSESVLASFRETVQTVAGASELEITSPVGGVDEEMIAHVAGTEGVRAAAGIVESFLTLADRPDETVYLLGLDFLDSPVWQDQLPRRALEIRDELVFLSRPDSVVLSRSFVERAGLTEGGELRVMAPGGVRALLVRGFLHDVPAARL